jgi:hypothetical protein
LLFFFPLSPTVLGFELRVLNLLAMPTLPVVRT